MDVNIQCYSCQKYFSLSNVPVCVFPKCGHLTHLKHPCFSTYCLICEDHCGPPISLNEINENSQYYINGKSIIREIPKFNIIDRLRGISRVIISLPFILSLGFRLYFNLLNKEYVCWLNNYIVKLLNIKVKISNKSKLNFLDNSYKRILIANHTNFHDSLVIGSLLGPTDNFGFVASRVINSTLFGKALVNIMPNIIINENKNVSNYNIITEYFNKYPKEKKLLIFPEGFLSHSEMLCKFRSTAFKLGYPVQPIILKYNQNIFNLLNFDILCNKEIIVKVKVMDPINTDGSYESIENIRKLMAQQGNFKLSNVISVKKKSN